MRLIDEIQKSRSFVIKDAVSDQDFSLHEILNSTLQSFLKKFTHNDIIFIYSDNSLASLIVYLNAMASELTIALLNAGVDLSLKRELEKQYAPKLIFDPGKERSNTVQKTIFFAEQDLHFIISPESESAMNVHPNCKLLLSTSGTTGSPKFVKLSQQNLLENARSIAGYLPISSKDVVPLNLPIYYSYGLSILHSNAISGATVVCGLKDVLDPLFWKSFTKYEFSTLAGVPFLYEMLNRIGFLKRHYPSLKYLTQAGGNLNKKLKRSVLDYAEKNQVLFFVMYGQTEATARISYVPPDKLKDKITSIGIPIPNGNLSIAEDNSELLYRGPNVFGGYAEHHNDLSKWDESGILYTGDVAEIDNDGYYYITGRLKRFVKLFGNRINLDEMERHLNAQFNVRTMVCLGVADQYIMVSCDQSGLDEKMIKEYIFKVFKIHSKAIKYNYLDQIPLNANGKIDYSKILNTHELQRLP